jgi:tetratricopeptide (TPR) repeat protein
MRRSFSLACLLLSCLCAPVSSNAQSTSSGYAVSVRELQIPPKARREYKKGLESLARQGAEGSLPHFQAAIAEYPGYYEAYDRIGAADLQLWRIAEAEQAFRKSIEVSGGGYARPLLALGAILDDHKNFAEAANVIRKGLDLAPESINGYYYLGRALFGLNHLEEAESNAREALRRKLNFPSVHLLLADIHGRRKDYDSLMADLNEYLKLAPDGPASEWARNVREAVQRMIAESQSATVFAAPQP